MVKTDMHCPRKSGTDFLDLAGVETFERHTVSVAGEICLS